MNHRKLQERTRWSERVLQNLAAWKNGLPFTLMIPRYFPPGLSVALMDVGIRGDLSENRSPRGCWSLTVYNAWLGRGNFEWPGICANRALPVWATWQMCICTVLPPHLLVGAGISFPMLCAVSSLHMGTHCLQVHVLYLQGTRIATYHILFICYDAKNGTCNQHWPVKNGW